MEHLSAFPKRTFTPSILNSSLPTCHHPASLGKVFLNVFQSVSLLLSAAGTVCPRVKHFLLQPGSIWEVASHHLITFAFFLQKSLYEHAAIWKKGFFSREKRSQILVPSAVYPVTQCAVRDCGHSSSPALREVPVPSGKSHPLWGAVPGAASHGCWSINELIFLKYCEGLKDQESRSSPPRLQTHGEETRRHESGFHAIVML